MDLMLLRIYQRHVVTCCHAVAFGLEDINRGLADHERPGVHPMVWYGVQNLVVGAANISKTLWGVGRTDDRERRYHERQPLRDSLGVSDDSPLRRVRIRNDFEHLDERFEEWWSEDPNRNIATYNVGPPGMISGLHEKGRMVQLDPQAGMVYFWGNELDIRSVVREVERIRDIAVVEAAKPHW